MNADEIDEVLNAFWDRKYDKILKYADLEVPKGETQLFLNTDGNWEMIRTIIMEKIAKGDFQHFLDKMVEINENIGNYDVNHCIALLKCSKDKTLIKEVINKELKLGFRVVDLIKATEDVEYIKEIIEDKERRAALGLTDGGVVSLIGTINDQEYIKEKIDNIEKLGIKGHAVANLITMVNNPQKVIEILKKRDEFELDAMDYVKIAGNMDLEGLIEVWEKRNEIEFRTTSEEHIFSSYIFAYSDNIKKIMESNELRTRLNLTPIELVDMIEKLKNPDVIKEMIENKEKRESAQLKGDEIFACLYALGDSDYIKKIVNERKILGLDEGMSAGLVMLTGDEKLLDKFIENEKKKIENNGKGEIVHLDNLIMLASLGALDNPNYINKIIKEREIFGIDEEILGGLVIITKDEKTIDDFVKKEKIKNGVKDTNHTITLPENMTIGVEIESEGKNSVAIEATENLSGWACKGDGSLNYGVEVVSPILTGDTEKSAEGIKNVCGILNALRTNGIR